jgi:predicted N-acetyltransferase YhbS
VVIGLRIVPLADRSDLTDAVARWHWDEWGHEDPHGSLESWTEGLRRRSGRDRIPISWVALLGNEPIGSVALIDCDMATHPELWPWLSGLFVVPGSRVGGVGSALTAHCESAAAELGVRVLYLYTTTAEAFYRRRGWEVVGREVYGAEEVAVMSKRLAAPA